MIYLSRDDLRFLLDELALSPELRAALEKAIGDGGELSDDDADVLRDLCGDSLQDRGFDAEYEPTTLGRRLEGLIDRLFAG